MKFCSFLTSRILLQIILLTVLLLGLMMSTSVAQAASLVVAPTEEEYRVGDTFAINVYVDPQGKTVGSVRGELQYDSKTLAPESIVRVGTQFTDWSITPTINEDFGAVTFSGTSETGIRTPRTIFIVRFQVIAEGEAIFAFADPYIQTLDPEAGNILTEARSARVILLSENGARDAEFKAPIIYSSAFPNENAWYRSTSGEFVWSTSQDVTATAVTISPEQNLEPQREPDAVYTPPIDRILLTPDSVSLGEQYLSVRHQYGDEWSAVQTRRLLIDTVPPEPFTVEVIDKISNNSISELRFHSYDSISGIAYYEVQVGNKNFSVTPLEAYFGYSVPKELLETGSTLRVVAYDKAGNAREASNTLLFLPEKLPANIVGNTADASGLLIMSVLVSALALITLVVLLILYLRHEAISARRREESLRKETREVKTQTKKIFKALRDEIKEQIQTLSNKKRLNKNEIAAIEGLTQALSVSETLLDKEIDDVSYMLRK